MLEIIPFTLGPAQTNAYLVADFDSKDAAVIDPAWDGKLILSEAQTPRLAHRAPVVHARALRPHRWRGRDRGCAESPAARRAPSR